MDVKYIIPELLGLPWTCYEYAIIDIFSRYKDAVIERSFRTDEEEFFFFRMKKPQNYDDLREQFAM